MKFTVEKPSSKSLGFLEVLMGYSKGYMTCNRLNVEAHMRWCSAPFWRRQWHPTPVLLPGKSHGRRSLVACSPWGRWGSDTTERLHFHALEKEMATHSSVLAWRIPGMGEPGGLPSMGSHRVGHDWSDLAVAVLYLPTLKRFMPPPPPKNVKHHSYKICFGKYNDFHKNVMLTHKGFIVSFLVTDLLDIIHIPYNSPTNTIL